MRITPQLLSLAGHRKGAVAVMFAVALIPMLICVGIAVDYGRMVQYEDDLQNAVDEAALAGAAAFADPSEADEARARATNFLYREFSELPSGTLVNLTVTAEADRKITTSHGMVSTHAITVTADTAIATTFLGIVHNGPLEISATATAALQWTAARLIEPSDGTE